MGDHELEGRKLLEDAAHDQPRQREAIVLRPADARRQPIVVHAVLAIADRRRMDHHRDVEIGAELEERPCLVGVRVVVLMAGADHHALHAVDLDRAFQLLEIVVASVRDRACERIDLAGVLVLLLGQEFVDLAVLVENLVEVGVPQVRRVVADDGGGDAMLVLRRQHVLDCHRALALPGGRGLLLRRIDMGVEVDDHVSLPFLRIVTATWSARPSNPAVRCRRWCCCRRARDRRAARLPCRWRS